MNLAYRFPIIFWNCACLISDSGGNETEDNEENFAVENEMEEFNSNAESFTNDDSDDEDEFI